LCCYKNTAPEAAQDDLEALAEDIKANGLLHPVVIDDDGVLIDGRMRLAACERAGVEPSFERINGHDAEAFIWGANAKRRQMTKGQIAMIAAMGLCIAPIQRGDQEKAAKASGVSKQRLSNALTVREHASDLAQQVISGVLSLDAAYQQALANKQAMEWREDGLRKQR
jgi:ParB-like chromosome segregation protein Spo0J